jgi:hypothetical protein
MSLIVGLIAGLFLALLGLFGGFTAYEGANQAASCVVAVNGTEHCSPALVNGEYQVPDSGVVISSAVNNGPVAPEYQNGYAIEIDVTGHVTYTVTNEGKDTEYAAEIGGDGVQELLAELDSAGFFYLPVADEFASESLPVGGQVSVLTVQLADGSWAVDGNTPLESWDQETLDAAQAIVEQFVAPYLPSVAAATPIAD